MEKIGRKHHQYGVRVYRDRAIDEIYIWNTLVPFSMSFRHFVAMLFFSSSSSNFIIGLGLSFPFNFIFLSLFFWRNMLIQSDLAEIRRLYDSFFRLLLFFVNCICSIITICFNQWIPCTVDWCAACHSMPKVSKWIRTRKLNFE